MTENEKQEALQSADKLIKTTKEHMMNAFVVFITECIKGWDTTESKSELETCINLLIDSGIAKGKILIIMREL